MPAAGEKIRGLIKMTLLTSKYQKIQFWAVAKARVKAFTKATLYRLCLL